MSVLARTEAERHVVAPGELPLLDRFAMVKDPLTLRAREAAGPVIRTCSALVLLFAWGCLYPLQAQTSSQSITSTSNKQNDEPELRALLKQLVTELAQLRAELRQQRLDQHEIMISRLENDLRQLQLEKKNLEEQERGQVVEIAEFDEQLEQTDIDPAERAALEAAKAKTMTATPERLRTEKVTVVAHEQEIQERLLRERQLRQALLSEAESKGR
jgi:hypothetical protein